MLFDFVKDDYILSDFINPYVDNIKICKKSIFFKFNKFLIIKF